MTGRNRREQREARALAEREGIPYAEALRRHREERAQQATQKLDEQR